VQLHIVQLRRYYFDTLAQYEHTPIILFTAPNEDVIQNALQNCDRIIKALPPGWTSQIFVK